MWFFIVQGHCHKHVSVDICRTVDCLMNSVTKHNKGTALRCYLISFRAWQTMRAASIWLLMHPISTSIDGCICDNVGPSMPSSQNFPQYFSIPMLTRSSDTSFSFMSISFCCSLDEMLLTVTDGDAWKTLSGEAQRLLKLVLSGLGDKAANNAD